ncbi:hypothetical protein AT251_19895 [Enterovibrio nigricans]|nr:hypothetical protein [Enterovibrio nigricans]PKF49302.1 hypothetical protein AT251_19895 [Enterovibrio nigricans]
MEKYAILYAGHANYRHLNELEFMYRTLVTECGFKPRNINILYYNGMLDCSGVPKPSSGSPTGEPYLLPIKGRGTRLELLDAIATLKNKLARDVRIAAAYIGTRRRPIHLR